MDKKIVSVRNAMVDLDQLERSVSGHNNKIESPEILAGQMNKFMLSMQAMFDEGASMDESTMLQIPIEMLDHLDNPDQNNPELYQIKMMQAAEARAAELQKKITNLDELKGKIQSDIK